MQEKETIANELQKLKRQHRSLQLSIIEKAQKISQLQTKNRTMKQSLDKSPSSSTNNVNDGTQSMTEEVKQHYVDIYDSQLECLICNETFVFVTATNCGHLFCEDCIETWNYGNQTCPVCRADIMCLTSIKGMDNIIEKLTESFKPLKFQKERLELIKNRRGKVKEKKRLWYHEKTPNITEVGPVEEPNDNDDIDRYGHGYMSEQSESEQSDLEDGEWDGGNNQRGRNYDHPQLNPYYSPGSTEDNTRARFERQSSGYLPSPPDYSNFSPTNPSPSYSPIPSLPPSPPYIPSPYSTASGGTSPDYNVFSPATRGPGSPQPYSPISPSYSPSSPISPLPQNQPSPPYTPPFSNYSVTSSSYYQMQNHYWMVRNNNTHY